MEQSLCDPGLKGPMANSAAINALSPHFRGLREASPHLRGLREESLICGTRVLIDQDTGEVVTFCGDPIIKPEDTSIPNTRILVDICTDEVVGSIESQTVGELPPGTCLVIDRSGRRGDEGIQCVPLSLYYALGWIKEDPFLVNPEAKVGAWREGNYLLREYLSDVAFGYLDTLHETTLDNSDIFRLVSFKDLVEYLITRDKWAFFINTEKGVQCVYISCFSNGELFIQYGQVPLYFPEHRVNSSTYAHKFLIELEKGEIHPYIYPDRYFNSWDLDDWCEYYSVKNFGPEFSSDDAGDGPRKKGILIPIAKQMGKNIAKAVTKEAIGKPLAKQLFRSVNKAHRAVKKQKTSKNKQGAHGMSVELSYPASEMIRAYMDPFGNMESGIGSPRAPAPPSVKRCLFARGSYYIGEAGVAVLGMSPCLANDRPFVWYSDASYTRDNFYGINHSHDYSVASMAGLNLGDYLAYAFTNSNVGAAGLTSTTFNSCIFGRIDFATLKAQYTGTTLNESGQHFVYADPNGEQLQGDASTDGITAVQLSGNRCVSIVRNTRNTVATLAIIPPSEAAEDYSREGSSDGFKVYPYSSVLAVDAAAHDIGCGTGVILSTGVAKQPMYFEAACRVEYIGPGLPQAQLTRNCVDDFGYKTALGCIQDAASSVSGGGTFKAHLMRVLREKQITLTKDRRKCYTHVR